MFYRINDLNFCGSTVLVPSISIGNVPQLAVDLLISTLKPELVGYILHEDLIPVVGANAYDDKSRQLSTSCEVYYLESQQMVLLQVRGAIVPGCENKFCKDLIDWMISFNAKRLLVLMSVSAEIRKDKDLQGCQLRYALPPGLKAEVEDELKGFGWSEYENPVKMFKHDEAGLYVPGGGFGQNLYDIGNETGLSTMSVLMFAYEGDNESEALSMAEAVTSICGQVVAEWQKPVSWSLLYGSGPPPDIY